MRMVQYTNAVDEHMLKSLKRDCVRACNTGIWYCMHVSVPLLVSFPLVQQVLSLAPVEIPTLPRTLKCALSECQNPCFVDETGTVHECCGITHAMEHQRRMTIVQRKNNMLTLCVCPTSESPKHTEEEMVKGVTHCLLPECNQLVWPFKNYCGRSHADIGAQRQLACM